MPDSHTGAILAALKPLVSKPMWGAGWAGDVAWFEFGDRVMRSDRHGAQREVGEYALHVSSRWAWRTDSGFLRADEDAIVLSQLGGLMAHVLRGDADDSGRLSLQFDNGDTLVVEPEDPESDSDEIEYWRLFQPWLETPHVVVSNRGVEWHEA